MSHAPRALVALAGAALVATSLVGCGSSGPRVLTKDEWLRKADAICKATNAKLDALTPKLQSAPSQEAAIKVFREGADLQLAEVEAVRKLKAPPSISKQADGVLDAIVAGSKKLASDPLAVAQTGVNPMADAGAKATALGLKQCGLPSSAD